MFNNINNKSWFNNKVLFIISLVIMSFSSFISVFAVSSYLYNSNEVSFNNSSSSSINSSNVQGAIDELYADAHNFEEMSSRVAALEGRWSSTGKWLDIGKSISGAGGVSIYDNNTVRGSFRYDGGNAYLISYDGSGTYGQGTLDLRGNPVKVNGNTIDGVYFVNGCSGTFSYANMTKCFKNKI